MLAISVFEKGFVAWKLHIINTHISVRLLITYAENGHFLTTQVKVREVGVEPRIPLCSGTFNLLISMPGGRSNNDGVWKSI